MTEFIRSYPQAAPLISDLLAKNLDWPGAEEMAKRFKAMLPPQIQEAENGDQPPPEVMQLQQQLEQTQAEAQQIIQQLQQQIQEVSQKAQATTADKTLEIEKLKIDAFNAETNRLKVVQTGMTPEQVQAVVAEAVQGVSATPEPLIEQPKPRSKVSRAVKLDDGSWQVYTEYLDHQPQEQTENNEEGQLING
jgi:F0F1-type ATP synthase membrane subunit b/b'